MRNLARRILDLYALIAGRPCTQGLNFAILRAALRVRGYNNNGHRISGETNFVKTLAAMNPRICVDVGANKGSYSRLILDRTQATVYAFEPMPKSFSQLAELKEVFGDRLIAINKGVGEESGKLDIWFGDETSAHASFSDEVKKIERLGAKNTRNLRVDVVTLDDYAHIGPVDLIKIDVEGYESEVIKGGAAFFQQTRPKFVQIEYNHHQLFRSKTLFWFSEQFPGYGVYQLIPTGLFRVDPKLPENNIFHLSNFVFVRPDIEAQI